MNEVIQNKKPSEILAEKIADCKYGDILYHQEISDIIGESYGTAKYHSIITQTKKILQEKYSRYIESMHKTGYRVVNPDDTVNISMHHYARGAREMQKGQNVLTHAPVNEMSVEGRDTYRRVYDRAVLLNASVQGASVELKTLNKAKKHPLNIDLVREH